MYFQSHYLSGKIPINASSDAAIIVTSCSDMVNFNFRIQGELLKGKEMQYQHRV